VPIIGGSGYQNRESGARHMGVRWMDGMDGLDGLDGKNCGAFHETVS
jgi:hypothetical protein